MSFGSRLNGFRILYSSSARCGRGRSGTGSRTGWMTCDDVIEGEDDDDDAAAGAGCTDEDDDGGG